MKDSPFAGRTAFHWLLLLFGVLGCAGLGGGEADPEAPRTITFDRGSEVTPPALEQGWVGFLEGLDDARRAVEDPALFPPPPTDRNLAEG